MSADTGTRIGHRQDGIGMGFDRNGSDLRDNRIIIGAIAVMMGLIAAACLVVSAVI